KERALGAVCVVLGDLQPEVFDVVVEGLPHRQRRSLARSSALDVDIERACSCQRLTVVEDGLTIRILLVVSDAVDRLDDIVAVTVVDARDPSPALQALPVAEMQSGIDRSIVRLALGSQPLPCRPGREILVFDDASHATLFLSNTVQYTGPNSHEQG